MLHRMGPIRTKSLMNSVNSIEEIFTLSKQDLCTKTGLSSSQIEKLKRKEALKKSDKSVQYILQNKVKTTFITDPDYPERLKNCIDSPLLFFSEGNTELNTGRLVSIVGTRAATAYGDSIVRNLIKSFIGQDITVVSGLALGIDTLVHRYCVEFGIPTIAVLGHGIDRIYPARNKGLAERMKENGGIMTEFIPGTIPDRENFPKRNRIVAGLSDATIVVESKLKGGSLITANLANDYNRDVFAFPGSINQETSKGCNQLISDQKAHLMQSPSDFLKLMNWDKAPVKKSKQQSIFTTLNDIQRKIIAALVKTQTTQIDVLSISTSLTIPQLNNELFSLEMDGLIKSHPGNCYSIA